MQGSALARREEIHLAERQGIRAGTLRRAFADLKGKSTALGESVSRMWMWELPEESGWRIS